MKKSDLAGFRQRLLELRARLRGDMTQLADTALNPDRNHTSSVPTHLADLGSDNFEQELTLSLMGSEKDALDQITLALERIDDGSYGQCEGCGKDISKARLEAVPYAAMCVQCAAKRERSGEG